MNTDHRFRGDKIKVHATATSGGGSLVLFLGAIQRSHHNDQKGHYIQDTSLCLGPMASL